MRPGAIPIRRSMMSCRLLAGLLLASACAQQVVVASPDSTWRPFVEGDAGAFHELTAPLPPDSSKAGTRLLAELPVPIELRVGPTAVVAMELRSEALITGKPAPGFTVPQAFSGTLESDAGRAAHVRIAVTASGETALSYVTPSRVFRLERQPGSTTLTFQAEAGRAVRDVEDIGDKKTAYATGSTRPINDQLLAATIVVSATGEFVQSKGSPQQAFDAIAQLINEANAVLTSETALRLSVAAESTRFMYPNPQSDPFANPGDSLALIDTNINLLASQAADISFALGHAIHSGFTDGTGGRAYLGEICANRKSGAASTNRLSTFLHEIGHQLGARHTFASLNGDCSGNRDTMVEPGSGSTLMSYAGSCGADNIQEFKDHYYHASSLDRIQARLAQLTHGQACVNPVTEPRAAPEVHAAQIGNQFVVPRATPLLFQGFATGTLDAEPRYVWEQTKGWPTMRSHTPSLTRNSRSLPSVNRIDSQEFQRLGNGLPLSSEVVTYRLTARDDAGDFTVRNDREFSVVTSTSSGPFKVLEPAQPLSRAPGNPLQLIWEVAGTTEPPVSCSLVDILLAPDAARPEHLSIPLALRVPNSGNATITVPNVGTATGRLWVRCSTAPFGSVARGSIFINATGADVPVWVDALSANAVEVCRNETPFRAGVWVRTGDGTPATVTLGAQIPGTLVLLPAGASAQHDRVTALDVVVSPSVPTGEHTVQLTATSRTGGTDTVDLKIDALSAVMPPQPTVLYSNPSGEWVSWQPGTPTFSLMLKWTKDPLARSYALETSLSPEFDESVAPVRIERLHPNVTEGIIGVPPAEFTGGVPLLPGERIYGRLVVDQSRCGDTAASTTLEMCVGLEPPASAPTQPALEASQMPENLEILSRLPFASVVLSEVQSYPAGTVQVGDTIVQRFHTTYFEVSPDPEFRSDVIAFTSPDYPVVPDAEPLSRGTWASASGLIQLPGSGVLYIRNRLKEVCGNEETTSPIRLPPVSPGVCFAKRKVTWNESGVAYIPLDLGELHGQVAHVAAALELSGADIADASVSLLNYNDGDGLSPGNSLALSFAFNRLADLSCETISTTNAHVWFQSGTAHARESCDVGSFDSAPVLRAFTEGEPRDTEEGHWMLAVRGQGVADNGGTLFRDLEIGGCIYPLLVLPKLLEDGFEDASW